MCRHQLWEENPSCPKEQTTKRNRDRCRGFSRQINPTNRGNDLFIKSYIYASMTGKSIPHYGFTCQHRWKNPCNPFHGQLCWEGFDIPDDDGMAYANLIIPPPEEAMKQLAVYAAEKMVNVLCLIGKCKNRWYYAQQ